MLKNILGDWGSSLSDGDYACALAALGVLEARGTDPHGASSNVDVLAHALEEEFERGERTAVWRGALVGSTITPDSWRKTLHTDADALAIAWKHYLTQFNHDRQKPRVAVAFDWSRRTELFEFQDLYSWLTLQDVNLKSVVLLDSSAPSFVDWHWPVRVGVLAGENHLLLTLGAVQKRERWVARLSSCFTVGEGRDACDLLIVTAAALQESTHQQRTRIRASLLVCLDDSAPHLSSDMAPYRTLRDRVHAAGVAVVGARTSDALIADWFVNVMADLAHDVPIHGALWKVGRPSSQNPLILGRPYGLDRCRILSVAAQLDRVAGVLDTPRGDQEIVFGGIAAPPLRTGLADALRIREFIRETVDGEQTADEIENKQTDIDRARAPRWIQADVWRSDAPATAARSLAPSQWSCFGVHIGPTEQRRVDTPFPSGQLDFTQGDVLLTVQLEIAGAAVRPIAALDLTMALGRPREIRPSDMPTIAMALEQALRYRQKKNGEPESDKTNDSSPVIGLASSEILLPPTGDSGLALFGVYPQDQAARIDGRIAIIHKNRVLQTATFSAPIDKNVETGDGVTVMAKSIHGRDDDLNERREYDVAIEVSDLGGKLHLNVQRGEKVTPVQLQDLEKPITGIAGALKGAAVKWDFTKTLLNQTVFPATLFTLAALGSALEQHLRKICGDDIDQWERIHLVPSTNKFLPLEYVYDGPPPRFGATVCGNVLGALQHASCDRAVELPGGGFGPCPNQQDKSFLCPMHFWGFRKLIERNGTVTADASPSPTPPTPVTVPTKQTYGKVTAMLFAASDRAFTYAPTPQAQGAERDDLIKSLSVCFGQFPDAPDWDQWRALVKNKPNLLVLVAHTDEVGGVPALEIGDQKFLGRHEILADVSGAAGQPELLLLLGCSAADVNEDFQPYPECFRNAGVSIVLAPVAPIRGADAVPIAKAIAQLLATRLSRPEPTAFGELLPLLRRQLLSEGHAGVMGIVGFGDGDWLIGGQ